VLERGELPVDRGRLSPVVEARRLVFLDEPGGETGEWDFAERIDKSLDEELLGPEASLTGGPLQIMRRQFPKAGLRGPCRRGRVLSIEDFLLLQDFYSSGQRFESSRSRHFSHTYADRPFPETTDCIVYV